MFNQISVSRIKLFMVVNHVGCYNIAQIWPIDMSLTSSILEHSTVIVFGLVLTGQRNFKISQINRCRLCRLMPQYRKSFNLEIQSNLKTSAVATLIVVVVFIIR